MTNDQICKYIEHYIKKDKTKSAIMLTAPWGKGKSYFIQNELLPYLQKNGGYQCILISLYGVSDLAEISKSIFVQAATGIFKNSNFFTHSQKKSLGKAAVGTIFSGLTKHIGIDLSTKNLKKLYESINLSNKLIILEDIERTSIDVIELLGYVNNLVEQDSVKVLLVANEDEIIEYEIIQGPEDAKNEAWTKYIEKSPDEPKRKYTEQTLQYLRVKEKTISDTIHYFGDTLHSISQIISSFDNFILDRFQQAQEAQNLYNIMCKCENQNLRSFIFACQKTVDIFDQLPSVSTLSDEFIKSIFYGNVYFSLRMKQGKTCSFGKNIYYSFDLASDNYPLFRFCYNYIMYQELNLDDIEETAKAFQKMRDYDIHKTANDKDLDILFSYHLHAESEVILALQSIEKRLQNPYEIGFYDYSAIAVYSIIIKDILGCDIDSIKKSLVQNLRGRGPELDIDMLFRVTMDNEKESLINEYRQLRTEMEDALEDGQFIVPGFEYKPGQAEHLCTFVTSNEAIFYKKRSFASNFNMDRLANMFIQSNPKEMQEIRKAFLRMYRPINIREFFADDILALRKLLEKIKMGEEAECDKIKQLQYGWFIENLTDIIEKLR